MMHEEYLRYRTTGFGTAGIRSLCLIMLCCVVSNLIGGEPQSFTLVRAGKATSPVVVPPGASASLRQTATELAQMLTRLGANGITVEEGDGMCGIALGHAKDLPAAGVQPFSNDPLARESYVLRSHGQGLWLVGASDLALSHAAWDLLHRLGVRQYFPGPAWEVVPAKRDLTIGIDLREQPAFAARRIWYNWGMMPYNQQPYTQWCVRNRMARGFALESGHSYEAIIAANRAAFDAHPEYFALVGGERKMRGDVKFCIANPGLRALVVDHALRFFRNHPDADSISLDPSDGDNWCECDQCVSQFKTIADRVVTLGNVVGEALDAADMPGKRIGMYAYNRHTGPPTIRVHPRIIASATTAFIGGGLTHDQVLAGWQAQGATMGVYDYLSVVDWDWNLPHGGKGGRPEQIAADLPRYHRLGARFYDAESGDCWGPCGFGYWASSRMLWDLDECRHMDALLDDFITCAFPGVEAPMRAFYDLLNFDTQRRSPGDLLARLYRHLATARAATIETAVRVRLDALVQYVHYVELYTAFADGRGAREDVLRHAWRMRETMLVHTYGLWSRLATQREALQSDHPLKDDRPVTKDELDGWVAHGVAAYQPVDPGFSPRTFSTTLVPATPRLQLNEVPAGHFPNVPQDRQRWWLWLHKTGGLTVDVTIQKVWATRMPLLELFATASVHPDPVARETSLLPDNQSHTITLMSEHAGLHHLDTRDGGDYTRITWPQGLPVTIESGIDTPGVTSHMRGAWTLSFYVPKGTTVIGGWASRIANWAPPVSGTLRDGNGIVRHDFTGHGDGWFAVPVPAGQDGKLWTFADTQGQRLLMTVPPYLARTGAELLLPSEVVTADGAPGI